MLGTPSMTAVEEYDRAQEARGRAASRWVARLGGAWLFGLGCGGAIVAMEGVDWNTFGPLAPWMDVIWMLAFCAFLASGAVAAAAVYVVARNRSVLPPGRIVIGVVPWVVTSGLGGLFLFAVFF